MSLTTKDKQLIEHEWVCRDSWKVCRKCGIVKRKDGENKSCKGTVPITTRKSI